MLLWVILILIVIGVSFFLALRSMKDFKDLPETKVSYSLFLVKNPHGLDLNLLHSLHEYLLNLNAIISFERLLKGMEKVLVIYGPSSLKEHFKALDLLELEDYLEPVENQKEEKSNKVNVNQTTGWMISPKSNPQKKLQIDHSFLKLIELEEAQRFFWQVVCQPVKAKNSSKDFQVTIRCIAIDLDPVQRVELSKKLDQHIFENTGLTKQARQATSQQIFKDYKLRSFVPKESVKFILSVEEINSLIS